MKDAARVFRTGGFISARPVVADLDGDGRPELIAASDGLYAWRLDGRPLAGFPAEARHAVASTPAVGDVEGEGGAVGVGGSVDDHVYCLDCRGRLLPGWPQATGGDVYSSPALADLDADGRPEIVVGSDDGRVYAWKADGRLVPGWPTVTGGFVAASPLVTDLDRDGRPEVVVGSWDRHVYVWRADGRPLPGWPQPTGHFVWATAAVADLDGDGSPEVVAVSDRVYVWRANGTPLLGWPQAPGSYGVGAPVVADLDGDGRPEVMVAADRLYGWRADGRPLAGFPAEVGSFVWATPLAADLDGDRRPEILAAGWDGILRLFRADGSAVGTFRAGGPVFASPVLAGAGPEAGVLVAAWDGRVYRLGLGEFGPGPPAAADWPRVRLDGRVTIPALRPVFIEVDGPVSVRAVLFYRRAPSAPPHPVPLVVDRGRLVGLLPPFPARTEGKIGVAAESDEAPAVAGHFRVTVGPGEVWRRVQAAIRRRWGWTWRL